MSQLFLRRPNLLDLPPLSPPAGTVVRAAAAGDEEGLARCLTAAFGDAWDAPRVRRDLTEAADVDTVFLVETEGSLAATASAAVRPDAYPGAGYVHWVGTDPAFAGRGLGALATVAVLHRFRELGLASSVLHTDDFRIPALKVYLRLGFVPEMADPEHPARWAALRDAGLPLPGFG